jgi:fructose-1,6-bisphosphatase I
MEAVMENIIEKYSPLEAYLDAWTMGDPARRAIAETVAALAKSCITIAALVAKGPLAGEPGKVVGNNADGDAQQELDMLANQIIVDGLCAAPVDRIISEEMEKPMEFTPEASLTVAVDPLDGSSNIDTNLSLGTIFSITSVAARRLPRGADQVAAGYVIYGPQTMLVLSVGDGTHIFTLDPDSGVFKLTTAAVSIPTNTREFAINVSNFSHWDGQIKTYIGDCLDGEHGRRKDNFNMRWNASLVADCHRILSRGGIFLYPADGRKGYAEGRLRLLYEANPIAFLIEQAGARASSGRLPILELDPTHVHQRVPLIFGSVNEVERVESLYADLIPAGDPSPLFEYRGLFRY